MSSYRIYRETEATDVRSAVLHFVGTYEGNTGKEAIDHCVNLKKINEGIFEAHGIRYVTRKRVIAETTTNRQLVDVEEDEVENVVDAQIAKEDETDGTDED